MAGGLRKFSRAVWVEEFKIVDGYYTWQADDEKEGTIPTVWVKDNILHWPSRVNEASYRATCKNPNTESWRQVLFIKHKFTDDNLKLCMNYDNTTSEVESGSTKRCESLICILMYRTIPYLLF